MIKYSFPGNLYFENRRKKLVLVAVLVLESKGLYRPCYGFRRHLDELANE